MLRRFITADVTTGASRAYPKLQPLITRQSPERVLEVALELAQSMPRWREIGLDPETNKLRAQAISKRMGYIDYVSLWTETDERGTVVMMRSKSRAASYDFGVNARRVSRFLTLLEERLGA